MDIKKINWPGLGSAVTATILLVVSIAYAAPWWQLSIAQGMGHVNISPLDFKIQLLGIPVDMPLLWFINLAAKLTLLTVIIALFMYSVIPEHKYSKNLLNYGYKRPLMLVIGLIIIVILITILINSLLPFDTDVPIMGTTAATITAEDATISVPVTTGFTWAFWLAIITAALAITAKIYHKKIITPKTAQPKPSSK